MKANLTHKAIDHTIESNQDSSHRKHLGASVIGRPCARQLWYLFRWAKISKHKAQVLRLFNRGHLEESRFIKMLNDIGTTVWEIDATTGKQFTISDCKGHFGGSIDGICDKLPDLLQENGILTEFKTHGDKSFKELLTKGLFESKPEHIVQMRIYMNKLTEKFNIPIDWGLYMAVNKNTDDLFLEIVSKDDDQAKKYIARANTIIFGDEPPLKINESPSWFLCRFCNFRHICHYTEIPEINCRTCTYSTPIEDKKWDCSYPGAKIDNILLGKFQDIIKDQKGCNKHLFNPYILNFDLTGGNDKEQWISFEIKATGQRFKHGNGEGCLNSAQLRERFNV